MKYLKAKCNEVMKCPECNWFSMEQNDGDMPDRHEFRHGTDEDDVEYVECPCGCRFVEAKDSGIVFIENVFEIAFGDNAINRNFTPEEVIEQLKTFSINALKWEEKDE
jgi:hypothetical protein